MRICVLTPLYVNETSNNGGTPVVHYFAREWVKMGHEVIVFNIMARYPRVYYFVSRLFRDWLSTRNGMVVPTRQPKNGSYMVEGVSVRSVCLRKYLPHSRYDMKQLEFAIDYITKAFQKNGIPDIFIGHWDNPQMEILYELKHKYHKPTCLVFHNNRFGLKEKYGESYQRFLKGLDIIGFRNIGAKTDFERK